VDKGRTAPLATKSDDFLQRKYICIPMNTPYIYVVYTTACICCCISGFMLLSIVKKWVGIAWGEVNVMIIGYLDLEDWTDLLSDLGIEVANCILDVSIHLSYYRYRLYISAAICCI